MSELLGRPSLLCCFLDNPATLLLLQDSSVHPCENGAQSSLQVHAPQIRYQLSRGATGPPLRSVHRRRQNREVHRPNMASSGESEPRRQAVAAICYFKLTHYPSDRRHCFPRVKPAARNDTGQSCHCEECRDEAISIHEHSETSLLQLSARGEPAGDKSDRSASGRDGRRDRARDGRRIPPRRLPRKPARPSRPEAERS